MLELMIHSNVNPWLKLLTFPHVGVTPELVDLAPLACYEKFK